MFYIVVAMVLTAFVMMPFPVGAKGGGKHNEVTVDDDGPADYTDIQVAIDSEPDGTKIKVQPGTYGGFVVDNRNDLKIEGKNKDGDVIVTESVSVPTYRDTYSLTIGVVDSTKIEIKKLTVLAGNTDPFTIAYFNSTGKVKENDVGGNTGNVNPGNGIAAFGISSPGEVKIEKNHVHDYGKVGILVNSWDEDSGVFVPGGIYAKIKDNTIVGTDFADYFRVQDGIQVNYGGSAKIEKNDISGNFQTGTYTDPETDLDYSGSYWSCDGILLFDAYEVETKHNKIYNNQMGITIQKYVNNAKLEHDDINNNQYGIYTWNWIPSTIEVKHAKIKENDYGLRNWDTNGIVFDHCHIEKNEFGIFASAWSTENPTATFNHCKIKKNLDTDVTHGRNTLVFHKTKYNTYVNIGEGVLIED